MCVDNKKVKYLLAGFVAGLTLSAVLVLTIKK